MASVIAIGLLWRFSLFFLPATWSKYGGDALWSLMVFFGLGLLFPRLTTRAAAALALLFSFLVETSQLYHAPWIDAIRSTRLGALALGSIFNWPDFLAYTVGVLIGVALEFLSSGVNCRGQGKLG
jgi:glycopeptide antibiotics resistance protein